VKIISIDLDRDGWTGQLQLSINATDENGSGHGYRIFGPKYNGSGHGITRVVLDRRDADEIRAYLDQIEDLP
jgi:hypothetical protein